MCILNPKIVYEPFKGSKIFFFDVYSLLFKLPFGYGFIELESVLDVIEPGLEVKEDGLIMKLPFPMQQLYFGTSDNPYPNGIHVVKRGEEEKFLSRNCVVSPLPTVCVIPVFYGGSTDKSREYIVIETAVNKIKSASSSKWFVENQPIWVREAYEFKKSRPSIKEVKTFFWFQIVVSRAFYFEPATAILIPEYFNAEHSSLLQIAHKEAVMILAKKCCFNDETLTWQIIDEQTFSIDSQNFYKRAKKFLDFIFGEQK